MTAGTLLLAGALLTAACGSGVSDSSSPSEPPSVTVGDSSTTLPQGGGGENPTASVDPDPGVASTGTSGSTPGAATPGASNSSGQSGPASATSTVAPSSGPTTTRPRIGPSTTIPYNRPGYPGFFPQPVTVPPPVSPPQTGPTAVTSTIFIGPTTTGPRPTTTTTNPAAPFRCSVQVFSSGTAQVPAVTVNVVNATKPAAWVVVSWGSTTSERGLELPDGVGNLEFGAPNRTMPTVEVFANNLKRTSDLGCQA